MHGSPSQELDELFRETVALYWRLTADAAAIHRKGSLSGPRRTILQALASSGPQTVAHLARQRSQSRQRFQPLVNALIREGLVRAQPNPVHRRSALLELTADGHRHVKTIIAREQSLRDRLRPSSSRTALKKAAAVLRDVRQSLAEQMPRLIVERR